MSEFAARNEPVILSDKLAYVPPIPLLSPPKLHHTNPATESEFAADIMTLVCFTEPWGFVANSRDERNMLESWRKGLTFFGFAGRFRFLRDVVLKTSWGCRFLLPSTSDDVGMGYLMCQADREVSGRERRIRDEGFAQERPDYLQL